MQSSNAGEEMGAQWGSLSVILFTSTKSMTLEKGTVQHAHSMKLFRLIKMYLNETYNKVCCVKICLRPFLFRMV